MNIKKIITGLSLSMLLSSGTANADWGDVYYCQMTNFNKLSLEGENESWQLEKFQFKLDQTKNAMVFGSTSVFEDEVHELVIGENWPSIEIWYANDETSMTYFKHGKFLFTHLSTAARVISADCEKF